MIQDLIELVKKVIRKRVILSHGRYRQGQILQLFILRREMLPSTIKLVESRMLHQSS